MVFIGQFQLTTVTPLSPSLPPVVLHRSLSISTHYSLIQQFSSLACSSRREGRGMTRDPRVSVLPNRDWLALARHLTLDISFRPWSTSGLGKWSTRTKPDHTHTKRKSSLEGSREPWPRPRVVKRKSAILMKRWGLCQFSDGSPHHLLQIALTVLCSALHWFAKCQASNTSSFSLASLLRREQPSSITNVRGFPYIQYKHHNL